MRYFFHGRDTVGLIPDEEGSELPDLAAARHEGRLSARDFAIDNLRCNMPVASRIEIADEAGRVLYTLPVRDVIH